jgi:hypothetical protein
MDLPCEAGQVEFIIWRDAVNMSTRSHVAELDKVRCAHNTNLGWVINENTDRLVLAHGISDTGEVDHFVIPKNCVIERIPIISKATKRKTSNG